jgi:hypothetical protein
MARNFDVCVEGQSPMVQQNGLNTNKVVDFSGSPMGVFPVVDIAQTTTASLGTTQNSTPTAAQLLGGIVTQTGATGAGTVTLPTGTVLSTAVTALGGPAVAVGYTFDCVFANLGGSQTLTLTAGASGMTMIGTVAVGSGKNAYMTFVCTAANTWSVYCIVSA